MERLLAKGTEFYLCARHLNQRGMREVFRECEPIVRDLLSQGKTFAEVKAHFDAANGTPIDLEKDRFLSLIKTGFESAWVSPGDTEMGERK